jgi:hypothetical protein
MMKKSVYALMALTAAGLVSTGFAEPFTLKEADHKMLLDRGLTEWDMMSGGLQPLRPNQKAPEGLFDAKIKYYFSNKGPAPMLLIAKSSKEAKTYDRAILDANANRDFTDDQVLTLDPEKPVDVSWQPNGREAVDYRIYLMKARQGTQSNIALLPKLWREGSISIDGKPVRALLQNAWGQKTLILDRDGDGKFNFNSPDDLLQLSTYMQINNVFYKATEGEAEDDWRLEPFTGPFGKLELSGEMVPKETPGEIFLVLTDAGSNQARSRSGSLNIKVALTNQPVAIPAGEYTIRHGVIPGATPKASPVTFRMNNKLAFSPDQVTKLILNKPKIDLDVTQKGRTLSVNRVVGSSGTPGLTYSLGRDKEPLIVDVVDPTDQTKVLIGRKNMEYG